MDACTFNPSLAFTGQPGLSSTISKLFSHISSRFWVMGSRKISEYPLNWLAHLIQKPWEKPGVCLCFQPRSDQSTDKARDHEIHLPSTSETNQTHLCYHNTLAIAGTSSCCPRQVLAQDTAQPSRHIGNKVRKRGSCCP